MQDEMQRRLQKPYSYKDQTLQTDEKNIRTVAVGKLSAGVGFKRTLKASSGEFLRLESFPAATSTASPATTTAAVDTAGVTASTAFTTASTAGATASTAFTTSAANVSGQSRHGRSSLVAPFSYEPCSNGCADLYFQVEMNVSMTGVGNPEQIIFSWVGQTLYTACSCELTLKFILTLHRSTRASPTARCFC